MFRTFDISRHFKIFSAISSVFLSAIFSFRKALKESRATRILVVLTVCFSFVLPTMAVLKSTRAATTLQNNNYLNLNPFISAISSFEIYDDEVSTSVPIGTQPASEIYQNGNTVWTPSSEKYPRLQMYVSQPFLVDNDGHESLGSENANQTNYIVDPSQRIVFDFDEATGKYTYLTRVNVAFDYFIKTLTHVHTPTYNFYPISPLAGISSTHYTSSAYTFTGTDIFRLNAAYTWGWYTATEWYPRDDPPPTSYPAIGVLAAGWDYGGMLNNKVTRPNPTTWYVGNNPDRHAANPATPEPVGIGISLENFRDISGMNYNLAHNYGNSPVRVVAKIDCDTNDNGILYNYYREVDGNTFNVKTTSTKMGIYDASLVQGMNVAGEVPTYVAPADYYRVTDESISNDPTGSAGDEPTAPGTGSEPTIPEDLPPGTVTTAFNSWYTCSSTRDVMQPAAGLIPTQTLGKPSALPIRTSITINNFQSLLLPKQTVTMTDYIQPYSTASMATYTGRAVRFEHYFLGTVGSEQKTLEYIQLNDEFPYRMSISNTYITHRVVMTYLVASENEILYVPASGTPVKVTDFTDYGINYVGVFNPNLNDAGGSVTIYNQNLADLLFDFLSEFGWLIAVVVIGGAVVIVSIVVLRMKKPQNAQGSRRAWSWKRPTATK